MTKFMAPLTRLKRTPDISARGSGRGALGVDRHLNGWQVPKLLVGSVEDHVAVSACNDATLHACLLLDGNFNAATMLIEATFISLKGEIFGESNVRQESSGQEIRISGEIAAG